MASKKPERQPAGLVWAGPELPRIPPGDYQGVCVRWQGPEFVRAFRRWSLRLEFQLLSEDAHVSAFLNMGNDPNTPRIGRKSRFYAAWCQANGEPPRRGQQMSLDTFTEPGLLYLVRVEDATKDGKEADKPDSLVYSRVTEILRVEHP